MRVKIAVSLLFILALNTSNIRAQTSSRDTVLSINSISGTVNIINFELYGNAVLLSLNYEHIFSDHFGFRVGLGLTPYRTTRDTFPRAYTHIEYGGLLILMAEYHYPISNTWLIKSGLGTMVLTTFANQLRWEIAPDSSNVLPLAATATLGVEYIGKGFTASFVTTPSLTISPMYFEERFGISVGLVL